MSTEPLEANAVFVEWGEFMQKCCLERSHQIMSGGAVNRAREAEFAEMRRKMEAWRLWTEGYRSPKGPNLATQEALQNLRTRIASGCDALEIEDAPRR